MRIEFGELQKTQTASLAAFPAFVAILATCGENNLGFYLLIGVFISFWFLSMYAEKSLTLAFFASVFFGVCSGLLNNTVPSTIMLAPVQSGATLDIEIHDALFSLSLVPLAALMTFVRLERVKDWLPSNSNKLKHLPLIVGVALLALYMLFILMPRGAGLLPATITSLIALSVIGRYKALTPAYAFIAFFTFKISLMI